MFYCAPSSTIESLILRPYFKNEGNEGNKRKIGRKGSLSGGLMVAPTFRRARACVGANAGLSTSGEEK